MSPPERAVSGRKRGRFTVPAWRALKDWTAQVMGLKAETAATAGGRMLEG